MLMDSLAQTLAVLCVAVFPHQFTLQPIDPVEDEVAHQKQAAPYRAGSEAIESASDTRLAQAFADASTLLTKIRSLKASYDESFRQQILNYARNTNMSIPNPGKDEFESAATHANRLEAASNHQVVKDAFTLIRMRTVAEFERDANPYFQRLEPIVNTPFVLHGSHVVKFSLGTYNAESEFFPVDVELTIADKSWRYSFQTSIPISRAREFKARYEQNHLVVEILVHILSDKLILPCTAVVIDDEEQSKVDLFSRRIMKIQDLVFFDPGFSLLWGPLTPQRAPLSRSRELMREGALLGLAGWKPANYDQLVRGHRLGLPLLWYDGGFVGVSAGYPVRTESGEIKAYDARNDELRSMGSSSPQSSPQYMASVQEMNASTAKFDLSNYRHLYPCIDRFVAIDPGFFFDAKNSMIWKANIETGSSNYVGALAYALKHESHGIRGWRLVLPDEVKSLMDDSGAWMAPFSYPEGPYITKELNDSNRWLRGTDRGVEFNSDKGLLILVY